MRVVTIVVLALFLCLSVAHSTASISPRLQQSIESATLTGESVRALVVLKAKVDLVSLNRDLYGARVSPQERAFTVITALQAVADRSQPALIDYLRTQTSVISIEPYWVINMIMVEADPAALLQIATRSDVDLMELDSQLDWDRPVEVTPAPLSIPNGSEPGIRAINAHRLWELGYTGAGRIVMNIDTGVNGSHPALNYKWRGNHVPWDQAWKPWNGSGQVPVDCDGHGTHTMGTMTGLEPGTHDTVGVAPDAEWIASNSLCAGSHTSYSIAAFQWAMDPDGDPMTIDDMPDAIGNSWYDPGAQDCATGIYKPVFDAVEAAGIAIVFSAGNDGPGGSTITVPKNTNTDLVNVWATGAVDGNNPAYPIASFSSRGPSSCGGDGSLLIKPEACAPGVSVRSSYGTGYSFLSGTSMACPHVVGAIALLKQAVPHLTGTEIKLALYNTARDLGTAGEDNNYGMGIIDVYAAFISLGAPNPPADFSAYSDYLTPTSIALSWNDPTNLVNGDTLTVGTYHLFLSRDGELIDSVEGGVGQYVDAGLVAGQEYAYGLWTRIDSTLFESNRMSATWSAGGAAQPAAPLSFAVGGNQDEVEIQWTNPSTNVDGTPMIDFAGINLYQDDGLVSTFTRTPSDTGSADSQTFMPATPGVHTWFLTAFDSEVPSHESSPTATLLTPLNVPMYDHFGIEGIPNPALWLSANADINDRSDTPPSPPFALNLNGHPIGGDTVTMQPIDLSSLQGSGILLSYWYQPEGNGNAPETGDSLMLSFMNDLGEWISVRKYPGTPLQPFTQEVLDIETLDAGNGTFFHSQFQLRFISKGSQGSIPNDDWFVDNLYLGVSAPVAAASPNPLVFDSTLVGGSMTLSLNVINPGLEDLAVSDIISGDPGTFNVEPTSFTVEPGSYQAVDVTFTPQSAGVFQESIRIVSNDPSNDTLLVNVSGTAVLTTSAASGDGLPVEYAVSPNYPNPFNPSTTIKFQLPQAGHVDLVIYSVLGDEVIRLVSDQIEAGYHEVVWDGKNSSGVPVTSGVYLYRFSAGDYLIVRKMLLLK